MLFMWLFALLVADGLTKLAPWMWGAPLVLAAFYLIYFAAKMCYKEMQAVESDVAAQAKAKQDEEKTDTSLPS